jgi:hypothetical protein
MQCEKNMQRHRLHSLVRPSPRSLAGCVDIRAMCEAELLCAHLRQRASCIGKALRVSKFRALDCDMFFEAHACELELVTSTCLTSPEYRVIRQLALLLFKEA